MKRILLFFAIIAAFVIPSCKEEPDGELPVPEYKEYHAKLTLTGSELISPIQEGLIPAEIEITSDGLAVCAYNKKTGGKEYKASRFVLSKDAESYDFVDLGLGLVIEDRTGSSWPVTLSRANGLSLKGTASAASDLVQGSLGDNLCRNWTVTSVSFTMDGDVKDNLKAGKKFTGLNVAELAQFVSENGVEFEPSEYSGHTVNAFVFTEFGSFIVFFADAGPFVGTYNLAGLNDKFSYNLEQHRSNPAIAASGVGTIALDNAVLTISINGGVQDKNGKDYNIDEVLSLR